MKTPVILIVDDDTTVLQAFERDVGKRYAGVYQLMQATGGAAAMETCRRLREQEQPVAVLVAAQRLASTSGTVFLLEARALHPNASRALLTSHSDAEAAIAEVNEIGLDRYR